MDGDSVICEVCDETLLNSLNENCREVEELALQTICSQHIPLLNSTLCLTQLDCKVILETFHLHCKNVTDHLIVLIALTDFISCVCSNFETFPLSTKKHGYAKSGVLIVLHKIKVSWWKLFNSVTANDITTNQLTHVMKITERCLERVPKNYKMLMEIILNLQNKALQNLLKSSTVNNQSSLKPKSSTAGHRMHLENLDVITMEVNNSKDPTFVNMPASKSACKVKKTKKENKGTKKKSLDITKFILKRSENVMKDEKNILSGKILPQKRKLEEIKELCINKLDTGLRAEDKEVALSPPSKKQSVHDDLINGKVNAFKMLMKSHHSPKPKITVHNK